MAKEQAATGGKQVPGGFTAGDPRINRRGRPLITKEGRERKLLQERAQAALKADMVEDLKPFAGIAMERLIKLVGSADESVARAACVDVLAWCWGRPAQAVAVQADVNVTTGTTVVTLEALRAAALRVAGLGATDAVVGAVELDDQAGPQEQGRHLADPMLKQLQAAVTLVPGE